MATQGPQKSTWPISIREHAIRLSTYLQDTLSCIERTNDQPVPANLVKTIIHSTVAFILKTQHAPDLNTVCDALNMAQTEARAAVESTTQALSEIRSKVKSTTEFIRQTTTITQQTLNTAEETRATARDTATVGKTTMEMIREIQDCYDAIDRAGTQEWSQGNVSMTGVSYLAWSQWRVAAMNPPHLKAINPNEGVTDFYRKLAYHGGIKSPFIENTIPTPWGRGRNLIENFSGLQDAHPFFDDYWKSKNADLSAITVPAYVVANWGDFGLHTRGMLEGFKKISSSKKWLRFHGRRKFPSFYEDQERQRQFFDKFLKETDSEVDYWPQVNLEIRERYYIGNYRAEQ